MKKSLKILYAMIKSPKMCNMLHKAERKRYSAEQLKQVNDSAILTLRQYKFDENADMFVEKIHGVVVDQLVDCQSKRV